MQRRALPSEAVRARITMTIELQNDDLRQNRHGLRFLSAKAELAYRTWRNHQNIPISRLCGAACIAVWTICPPIAIVWLQNHDLLSEAKRLWMLLLAYGFVVPGFAFMLIASFTRWRQQTTLLAAVALAIAGIAMQLHSQFIVPSAGGGAAMGVAFAAFALFMRLPPIYAALTIFPFMSMSAWGVWQGITLGNLSAIGFTFYAIALGTSFFFVVFMSPFLEQFIRTAFINETNLAISQQALQESRAQIRRYMPPAVADEIIAGRQASVDQPQRRYLTILFSDIVGFTELADRLEPNTVTAILSDYLASMARLIEAHGGTLNEFAGDGIMAIFGAPGELEPTTQAIKAIQTAHAMQAQMNALQNKWQASGLQEPLRIRIGINSGLSSVGSYGSEGRMTYTAIGLQTNIAARIQGHCEPGRVLIAESTYLLISDSVVCEAKGEVECKGVHFPVKVYAPRTQHE